MDSSKASRISKYVDWGMPVRLKNVEAAINALIDVRGTAGGSENGTHLRRLLTSDAFRKLSSEATDSIALKLATENDFFDLELIFANGAVTKLSDEAYGRIRNQIKVVALKKGEERGANTFRTLLVKGGIEKHTAQEAKDFIIELVDQGTFVADSILETLVKNKVLALFAPEQGSNLQHLIEDINLGFIAPDEVRIAPLVSELLARDTASSYNALRLLFENDVVYSLSNKSIKEAIDTFLNRETKLEDTTSRDNALYALFENGAGFTIAGERAKNGKPIMVGCFYEHGNGKLAAIVFDGKVFSGEDPALAVDEYVKADGLSATVGTEFAKIDSTAEKSLGYLGGPNAPSSFLYERGMMMVNKYSVYNPDLINQRTPVYRELTVS